MAPTHPARLAARRRHPSAGQPVTPRRTLALLDVENLLQGDPGDASAADYEHALAETAALAELTNSDSAVLAVGSRNDTGVFACLRSWPGAAVRCRSGEDGADRALTEHIADLAAVARAYQQVVIGSGDHHFVACVATLRNMGVRTTVIARRNKLSNQLRGAAERVLLLPGAVALPLGHTVAA